MAVDLGPIPSVSAGATRAPAQLLPGGIVVQDEFLSRSRVRDLVGCLELRWARGEFREARVGAGRQSQRSAEIRGDSTCWLGEPLFEAERTLLKDLEALRLEINRATYLGLFGLELHYARYPAGAGYARHVDQLNGRDQRKVSVILYLNEDWHCDSGGELRVFDAAGGHWDIEPIAGRLVYFLSAGREHAVLPTRGDRRSVSGWFRGRDQEGGT